MTMRSENDPRIAYEYTVTVDDVGVEFDWKSPYPQQELAYIKGMAEVGVRNAYTRFFEYYDILLEQWMKTFEILSADGKTVIPVNNVVYGTPERLFSVDRDEGVGSVQGRVTLPAISFRRTGITRRFDRGPTFQDARKYVIPTDNTFRNYVEIRSTYHLLDLSYQVDLWTKYNLEMQMLIEQLLLPFGGQQATFRLEVPYADFDETVLVTLDSLSDSSQLEPGDGERIIRHTATITVQAYVPRNVSKIEKTIKDIVLEKAQLDYEEVPETRTVTSYPSYTHEQTTASTTWVISHNLSAYPSVSVLDADNEFQVPSLYTLTYTDANTVTLTFALATAGKAICVVTPANTRV